MKLHQNKIVEVAIKDLNPSEYNPRSWSKKTIQDLTESVRSFGLVDPILANSTPKRKNVVIGGHFRLKVAKDLKYKTVPVLYLNIPDLEKEKELNIRLNKNLGEWNFDLLKDFDVNLLKNVGFDDFELEKIFDENLETKEDEFNTEEELKKIKDPKTKPGDLIELGDHRLICGDSTDPKVIKKLAGETKINMIYTDPPYNISYNYQKGLGKKQKYECDKVEDKRSLEEYSNFLESTLKNSLPYLEKDAHVFYYSDQTMIGVVQSMYRKLGIKNRRVCLWIKSNQNPTPKVAFNKVYEPCTYGTRGKPYLSENNLKFTEIANKNIGNGNQCIDDISEYLDLWMVKRLPTSLYSHPTQKPLELHERPLKRCTKIGDRVLDLFGGSGSLLISCEQMGRRAYLVEKDPRFCDLIRLRYEKLNK